MDPGPQNDTMSPRLNDSVSGGARLRDRLPSPRASQHSSNPMELCNGWQRRGVGFIGGACVDRPTEIPRVMSRARAVCLGPVGRAIEGRARRMRILRCQESTSARPLLISSRVSEQSRGIRVFNKQDSRAFRPAAGHSRLIYPILPPPQPTFSRATSPLHVLVTLISSESAHSEAAPEFKKARDRGSPSFRPG